ncbi:HAMP domain-containing protein [Paenibacillus sp. LMG 31458]|uniref:histidine kinase n=2 Tax=Paenibacillus phytorum TaxID=2654977 RepID=A0ABX1XSV4_9BACL|nr:HAMP domain-containing protein [Paenibacillus phytorum]
MSFRNNGLWRIGQKGWMGTMRTLFKRRYRNSLSNLLFVSFLVMFLLIFTISSIFSYSGILNILKNNAKENSLQQLKQYDYNLSIFAGEVDQASRQLVLDSELQNLIDYKNMTEIDRVLQMEKAFKDFAQMLSNYKFIDSISFYGEDGFVIRASSNSNDILYESSSKQNQFYRSEIYPVVKSKALTLTWFGGFTAQDFNIATSNTLSKEAADSRPTYYISAARSIFSNSQTGTIVINVDMTYFTDIYNHASDNRNREMYLVDGSGKIVSHSDVAKIGNQGTIPLQFLSAANGGDKFSSYEHDKKQIMSYKSSSFDWILIYEIPLSEFTKDIFTLRQIVTIMFIFSLVFAAILSKYWIRKVTMPLNRLTTVMKKMELGNLGLTLDLDVRNEFGILIVQFNKMSKSIVELLKQKETIEEEKRRIEIGALQSQINPHFFYNTLNTIKWMAIMVKADNIVESLTTLGDILHPMFKKNDLLCSIREEIEYLENYIKIMNYRYAGEIKVKISIPNDVMECQILRFLLQPLVENAIYHGLNSRNGGEIIITAEEQNHEIVLFVYDNGEGMSNMKVQEIKQILMSKGSEDSQQETGIGLMNVNRRILLHFGDPYGIQIESEQHRGTKLKVTIPKVQKS